jgi:hypothetical protein
MLTSMAKKTKPKPKKSAQRGVYEVEQANAIEQRGEAITVAWMLTMLATTGADVLLALAAIVFAPMAKQAEDPRLAPILPQVMLLIASICGIVCLLLTPVVYRFRHDPPPLAITVFGVIASIVPLLIVAWRVWG